jgi:hypothetical protein
MLKLYDNIERHYHGPANNRENTYDYYNRSGRKDISIVRDKMEEWFSNIPNSEKSEMKERFRKSFDSVFYELFLFNLFISLGFEITIHPVVPETTTKPDFLIKKGSLEIYVEAKISKDKSHLDEANENRLNQFYDSINKIKSPNFLLYVEKLDFKTDKQPQTKAIINYFENELSKLDPDVFYAAIEHTGLEGINSIQYSNDQIDIVIKPMPVIPSARGKSERAIGMFPFESFMGGAEESLQDSINSKAKRYGKLDKPYIICINALSFKTSSGFDVENAIWGSLAFSWSTDPNNRNEKNIRQPDGIFCNKKGARIQNVSGILVTRVFPHNIPSAKYWLFEHPFSHNKLDFTHLGLIYNFVENNIIIKNTGQNLDTILNIEKDWLSH